MSKILYYSNYCENCKKLLQNLAKSQEKKDIHFICIENSQEILLPPQINKVPALLFLNQKDQNIIFGEEINNVLKPTENLFSNKPQEIKKMEDPVAFSFSGGACGVVSDNYSFWDQDADSLSAKGDGGMRQLYNYSTINQNDSINTPEENYTPDKIGEVTIEKLQNERNQSLQSN
jgi:hypothetical protein